MPERRSTAESEQNLWRITAGPIVWAAHFLACYLTGAIWCAKHAGPDAGLGGVRAAVAVYTVVALAGIGWAAWSGWRRHEHGIATVPHDFDTPEDRHRFLGFATLLLAGVSAVATVYVALAAVFIRTCH
jgi:hypothetical protein